MIHPSHSSRKIRRDRGCRGAIGTLICIQWPTRSTEQTFYGGFGAARNDRSYRPFAARKRAFRFVRVEQVREAGVRHGCHDDPGRLNPRSTLRPRRWNGGGSGSIGKSGKDSVRGKGVTMGALSLEICREHAGWSVHCFNASFRWKTYRLASPSRKNSAGAKLTRRRTTGVDGEYKSRHRVAITTPASSSYSGFAKEVYICQERKRGQLPIDLNKEYWKIYTHAREQFQFWERCSKRNV